MEIVDDGKFGIGIHEMRSVTCLEHGEHEFGRIKGR